MKYRVFALVLFTFALIGQNQPGAADHPLKPEQFDKLHKLIQPQPDEEKWLQIPWLSNLWQARQQAAREGKPILLWEMDGHPLGCT